ncbi:hypothetical protein D5086_013713, partial [Populus alba]
VQRSWTQFWENCEAANTLTSSVKLATLFIAWNERSCLVSNVKNLVGTPFWTAPEVIQNSEGYNEKLRYYEENQKLAATSMN